MVDQETKPCGKTSFKGRGKSDAGCHKGCHLCDNTWVVLKQNISVHIAENHPLDARNQHMDKRKCVQVKKKTPETSMPW